MPKSHPLPDIGILNEALSYNPQTGVFVWRERPRHHFVSDHAQAAWNAKMAGSVSGSESYVGTGRNKRHVIKILINRKRYMAHRIAWVMSGMGDPGLKHIDHWNRNPHDNRICNLREATNEENCSNSSAIGVGVRGTTFSKRKQKWVAQITKNYKNTGLGYFNTRAEAALAYAKASLRVHGKFSPYYRPVL